MEGNRAGEDDLRSLARAAEDLGATRNIIEGIGSTDHVPFNEAGLPGFNVIKDFDAYDQRTRHTNADYPERMSEDELKQSAVFMATFAWQAATADEKIPARPPGSRSNPRMPLATSRLLCTQRLDGVGSSAVDSLHGSHTAMLS
jgi:Zn-dependent M28 family amino/carboxypeptidase